jgi:hypothetical protein
MQLLSSWLAGGFCHMAETTASLWLHQDQAGVIAVCGGKHLAAENITPMCFAVRAADLQAHLDDSVSCVLWYAVSTQGCAAHATVSAEVCCLVLLVLLVHLAGREEVSVQHVVQPVL